MESSDPASRILLLMRHGKADSSADQDSERDLTDRGVAQARLIGDYLESQGVRPTRVLVSPAARTRQSWDAVASGMPGFDGDVTCDEALYDGSVPEIVDLLRSVDDRDQVVLVVGHEPTTSTLAHVLGDDDSDSGAQAQARIGVPTGSMCVLSGPLAHWEELGEDSLTLNTVVRG